MTLTTPGSVARLSFRHSLYGSVVQEEFRVGKAGFQLTRLYYSEERLVEFYGYQVAQRERGWWVVRPELRKFPFLDLRVSADSAMQISTDSGTIPLSEMVETGGLVRISTSRCDRKSDEP